MTQIAPVRYLKRPAIVAGDDLAAIEARVRAIIDDVRRNGDEALRRYSQEFDGYAGPIEVEAAERQQIVDSLDPGIREDLDYAIANVTRFAEAQRATLQPLEIEASPGGRL